MDKTGTLTEGRPALSGPRALTAFLRKRSFGSRQVSDQGSEHPLAATIVAAARQRNLVLEKAENFESGTGVGVRGSVGSRKLALGNTALMQAEGIGTESLAGDGDTLRAQGASVMYLAVDGKLAGILAVRQTP
ncbi:HAD family hydrolase [Cupriavidus basilensis]